MTKEKGPITKIWLEAKHLISTEQFDKAEEVLDRGIAILSKYTLDGYGDKDIVENVKMEVWKERFWISLEKYIWSLYEEN